MPLTTYILIPIVLTFYLTSSKYPSLASTLRHIQRFHLIHTFPLDLPDSVRLAVDWFSVVNMFPTFAMWDCGNEGAIVVFGPAIQYCIHIALPVNLIAIYTVYAYFQRHVLHPCGFDRDRTDTMQGPYTVAYSCFFETSF